MKLVDVMIDAAGDTRDDIVDCCCPSSYGLEYDKYEIECVNTTCEECWNQEVDV